MQLKFSLLENIKPSKNQKTKAQQEHYEKIVKQLAGVYYRFAVKRHGKNKKNLPIKTIEWAIKHQPAYLIARTQTAHPKIAGFLSFNIDEKDGTLQIIERWARPEFGEKETVKALEKEMYFIASNSGFKRIGRIGMSINGKKEFEDLVEELKKEGEKIEIKENMMHFFPKSLPKKPKIIRRNK